MRILDWLTRRRRDLDLDEKDFEAEIRAHLTIATEERVADGADRADAHYAAPVSYTHLTLPTTSRV